jgi:hypothetical protein
MNGYNAGTGSNWSEHSMTMGNTTYLNGQASNGNSWNETEQHIGNMEIRSGTDSNGNSFYSACGPWGCTPPRDESLNNSGSEGYGLGNHEGDDNLSDHQDGESLGDSEDNDESLNEDDGSEDGSDSAE